MRAQAIADLTPKQAEELLYTWSFLARRDQLPPPGEWAIWLFLAGRGAGKTRSGAEWVRDKVKEGVGRFALVGPTAADARDVMVKGDSGILATSWRYDKDHNGNLIGRPTYEPSKRLLTWENGALALLFSAEEPERLRGPQHGAAWADEVAAWTDAQAAWDMLMFGLRLGENPQVMVSTTPKPIPLVRELLRQKNCVVTKSKTSANAANLAPTFLTSIVSKYKGTRLGRQELDGELLEEVEGALWNRKMFEVPGFRVAFVSGFKRIVVGVDPSITSTADSALCGIVVAAVGEDDFGYVIHDGSERLSPAAWAARVDELYKVYKADRVIVEVNQGGDMVAHTLRTVNPSIPITMVHASRGKQARAEPVAALYEQGRIRHVGAGFAELEDQMCTWEPMTGAPSPDRLDAMVWALTNLMIEGFPGSGLLEWTRQQAERVGQLKDAVSPLAPEISTFDMVRLRAPQGTSTVYGIKGDSYVVDGSGTVTVFEDDVEPLQRAGFTKIGEMA